MYGSACDRTKSRGFRTAVIPPALAMGFQSPDSAGSVTE